MDFIGCGRTIGRDETKDAQLLPLFLFIYVYLFILIWMKISFEDLKLKEMSFYKHSLKQKWRE